MIGAIIIKDTGATPRGMRRHARRITKEALAKTAAYHHRQFMHKHFTKAGAAEYGYSPRKGEQSGIGSKAFFRSYTGRKQRMKGHTLPLVWSGESRELAKIRDIRSTSNKARIVQHARGLNRRHPNSQVRMQDEIRAISDAEVQSDIQQFDRHYRRGIQQLRGRVNKTVRIT